MKTRNDLEYEKFILRNGNVAVNSETVTYWNEIQSKTPIDTLEEWKFNGNKIRIVTTF